MPQGVTVRVRPSAPKILKWPELNEFGLFCFGLLEADFDPLAASRENLGNILKMREARSLGLWTSR